MAYSATYAGSDLGAVFIDLFGTIVVGITQNAPTIVILLIVGMIAVFGGRALRAIMGIFNSFR